MKNLQRNLGYVSMKETCISVGTVIGHRQEVPRHGCAHLPGTSLQSWGMDAALGCA